MQESRNEEMKKWEMKNFSNSIIPELIKYEWLMVLGSWLKSHGSRLNARGSRLMPKNKLALGPEPGGPSATFLLAMSNEP